MAQIALLIDGENISDEHFREISKFCDKQGDVRVARVFGDFSEGRLTGWVKQARASRLEPVFQLSRGKNSTDIAMTIAAMDLLRDESIDAICIASDDRDFTPVLQRLRASGKTVMGTGSKSHRCRLL